MCPTCALSREPFLFRYAQLQYEYYPFDARIKHFSRSVLAHSSKAGAAESPRGMMTNFVSFLLLLSPTHQSTPGEAKDRERPAACGRYIEPAIV